MELQQANLTQMTPGELIDHIDQLLVIPGDVPTDAAFYASVISASGENVKRAYLAKLGHQLGFDL
jgi:hypothetical protein